MYQSGILRKEAALFQNDYNAAYAMGMFSALHLVISFLENIDKITSNDQFTKNIR